MNDDQIIKKLSDIFIDTLGVNEFELSLTMDEISEWDSLKHIQILTTIEAAFGIEIQFEDDTLTLHKPNLDSLCDELEKLGIPSKS